MGTKAIRAAIAAICAAAFSPAHAVDETITSDTMLTADRTVDGVLKMSPGVVVDLNGYTLLAKGVAIANDDLTSSSGTVTSPTTFANGTKASSLFDDRFHETRNNSFPGVAVHVKNLDTNPLDVVYDFGENEVRTVKSYKVYVGPYSGADGSERNPRDWTLEGSNDGVNWTVLDTQSETGWAYSKDKQSKVYDVATPGAYRYYRYKCTANNLGSTTGYANQVTMMQLEFLPYTESGFVSPTIMTPADDLTEPDADGSRVWSSTTLSLNTAAKNLFNNNFSRITDASHRVMVDKNNLPLVVRYDFGENAPRVVNGYKIWFGPQGSVDMCARAPKAWKFSGANSAEGPWTELDSRSEQSWTGAAGKSMSPLYSFENSTAYRYYKIEITENNGESFLEFIQLEYFCAPGTLVLDVPADTTTENDAILLAGNMTLVKKGSGTFLAKKTGQTYTGGTAISNGTFKCGANGTIFGASGSSVEIASGAVLDANGHYEYTGYPLVFAGGTLKNTGAASANNTTFGNIRLTADSAIDVANRYGFKGGEENVAKPNTFLDLGGHTLTISGAGMFNISNCKYDNGTIQELPGHSQVLDIRNGGVMTNNVTFISDGGFASYEGTGVAHYLDMQDYIAGYTQYNRGFGTSTSRVRVWGTFKPLSVKYHGLTMQNGSVLDLSEMTGTLPLVPNYVPGAGTLNFANGATVEIKVGQREVRSSTALVSWSAPPSNIGGVTFVCNDDSRRRKVQVKDSGLYFAQDGLMLIVK